ncbi:DgyrCDS5582 [Dimorphilus gyrociliatus]|uniref:DgyrCDS5582 n=1 Tax=Dimorphilus gyrociliatus TaxID=2664684 RepID=A0A7I8VMM1_9ANNE|nr:DgyrCDS5582 [Dimorphilus gyrociliatus]
MPKVKVLSRNPDDYVRETKKDIFKVPRNYNPTLHPFEEAREYTRALNATKLERLFAKPFLGDLNGHRDGVNVMCKHPISLSKVFTGACDGEVREWDLPKLQCTKIIATHSGFVRGMDFESDAQKFWTCGDDKTIKLWDNTITPEEPLQTILTSDVPQGLSRHKSKEVIATCGQSVNIYNIGRTTPSRSLTWGIDSIHHVAFNPIETEILASCASDRSIVLYDCRERNPLRKVILKLRSNKLAWNPLEAFTFTVANEDYNLYTFDMRKLSTPVNVHMNHISAVLDVDYSPTGKSFVSGSYDKTIRVFEVNKGRSIEVYHTKRMQRVNCVLWSLDNRYLLSASDEMNVRVWKANASEKLGVLKTREKESMNYSQKLKQKYKHFPKIKGISKKRHIPKAIYNAASEIATIRESQKRKESNRRAHSKPGAVPYVSERQKHVVGEAK